MVAELAFLIVGGLYIIGSRVLRKRYLFVFGLVFFLYPILFDVDAIPNLIRDAITGGE